MTPGYSSESVHWELSNENQHNRVKMFFKNPWVLNCALDESSLSIGSVNLKIMKWIVEWLIFTFDYLIHSYLDTFIGVVWIYATFRSHFIYKPIVPVAGYFGDFSSTKAILRKYLKERWSSEPYLQLSSKYFANSCSTSKLFIKVYHVLTSLINGISMHKWIRHKLKNKENYSFWYDRYYSF